MLNGGTPRLEHRTGSTMNPVGLKLNFTLEGQGARAPFALGENHQGQPGFAHNGILALLLDEAMGWIARHGACVNSVTAKLDIEYREPAKIGEPLVVVCRITRNGHRLLEESARIERPDGALIAEGNCLQYVVAPNPDPSAPDYQGVRLDDSHHR
jgi:acyl-coenzyme A thioesterase PaaI-like protein